MTDFLCIRHGDTDAVGVRLVGRLAGVSLNAKGRAQAKALAERLAAEPPDRIVCSPLERTRDTAGVIAERVGRPVEEDEGLLEIAFGEWTGRSFDELEREPLWRAYHHFRSGIRIPGGEMAVEVQARMVAVTERLHSESPDTAIALVSHGDPIRYLLAHYAGIPLDHALRLAVDVGSLSRISMDQWGPRVLALNSA